MLGRRKIGIDFAVEKTDMIHGFALEDAQGGLDGGSTFQNYTVTLSIAPKVLLHVSMQVPFGRCLSAQESCILK